MPSFRCAHISDLHFSKPSWSLNQFFSKRWLGNANLMLSRKQVYTPEHLHSLIDTFTRLDVKHVFITGDVSTTSTEEEFELAQEFVSSLKDANLNVFVLPGNHDQYTRKAHRDQLFYQFFETQYAPITSFNLKKDGLTIAPLAPKWSIILLDTALATSLISSCGLFNTQLEEKLEAALKEIPSHHNLILANHFPFFHNDSPRKMLKRGSHLRAILERNPQIRLYIHGHTHRHCIADLRSSNLPIVLDSGSTSHQKIGSWNLIDIASTGCTVQPYYWQIGSAEALNHWISKDPKTFTWELSDVTTLV
jgi:3',5'-cyclic AMP phosphodiesterase CpdA